MRNARRVMRPVVSPTVGLGVELGQQGRAWAGNPARSKQVADFKKDYRAQAAAAGVKEVAAVPLPRPKEAATLQPLHGLLAMDTRPLHWVAVARDGAMRSRGTAATSRTPAATA
jgi:hypothetical protein